MKNYTNIYDIDGNLIRAAGDNHKFTLEEVEKMVDDLTEKVKNNPENTVYKVYLNNAQAWLYNMYNNMSKEDLAKRLTVLQDAINEAKSKESEQESAQLDEVTAAMEKLKQEYEAENGEYVEFEEVTPENEGHKEDICTLHGGELEADPAVTTE